MKRTYLAVALSVAVIVSVSSCKSAKNEAPAPAPQAQSSAPAGASLSGKVVETMNSGGYTYVSLENSGKRMWVAMPQTAVKVGQNVTCQPGMPMENFTSKTLNRTFDRVIFSGGLM